MCVLDVDIAAMGGELQQSVQLTVKNIPLCLLPIESRVSCILEEKLKKVFRL